MVIELAQAPPLVHQGTRTLWPVYCSVEEANELLVALRETGVEVSILHQEPESPPVGHPPRTPLCSQCFFFAPENPEVCGLRFRSSPEIAAAFAFHVKAKEDRDACPDPPQGAKGPDPGPLTP